MDNYRLAPSSPAPLTKSTVTKRSPPELGQLSPHHVERESRTINARKQVLAGSIAAFVSTLVCHPIDVLRTELQTTQETLTARECLRRIWRAEGMQGFYKGLSAPLAAQAVYKAIIFGTNSTAQQLLLARTKKRPRPPSSNLSPPCLSYPEIFLCGALSGGVNALVVTPVELVRNRLVVSHGVYSGPRDCVGQAWRGGGFRGLWNGLLPTLCRDGPGVGAWFLAFAAGKDGLLAWKKSTKGLRGGKREAGEEKLGVGGLLLAGSGAGVAFWTVALPFDTVKSVMQVAG
ncbi:hypothetical protein NGA_0360510, partial [Nannochloropsis gaditana CCMP526]|uniref:uncharacterized protein n=1 Tax=Nannochloropsis gaditana (strain CCMP526) TaxID=1093141 RepID=UPI00029F71B7